MVVARRGSETVANVLRFIGLAFVVVLVLHILLTLLANPEHEVTRLVARAADTLDLGLSGLFVPSDPDVAVILNYGVAALLWYLITVVVVRLIRRFG